MDAFHHQQFKDQKKRFRFRPGWALTVLAAFIAICSNAQDLVWANGYGSTGHDQANKVVTDANGNVYVTGFFSGTIDFDPGPGVTNLTSATRALFISKLAADGTLIWAEKLTASGEIYPQGLALDGTGNIYLCGQFQGTADFDPGPGTANLTWNNYSAFVAKYDPSFGYQWAKEFHSGGGVTASGGVAIDGSGNVFLAGYFNETISTLNITNQGTFTSDGYIVKFNATGVYQWGRAYQTFGNAAPSAIGITSNDDLVVAGSFSSTMDGNPAAGVSNVTSTGSNDIFIGRLTNSGAFISINSFGSSTGYDTSNDLLIDANDNLFLSGRFGGTADLDPGPATFNKTAVGSIDAFLMKLDANLNLQWVNQSNGAGTENYHALDINANGEILIAGSFDNTIDFDPGAGSNIQNTNGGYDAFALKLDANGAYLEGITTGSTANCFAFAGAFGSNDNMLIAGRFEGTMDTDPGTGVSNIVSSGGIDAFAAAYGQAPVVDTTPPTVSCQSATIYVDANGNATLNNADVVATISDDNGTVSASLSQSAFNCSDVGSSGPDQSQLSDFLPIGGFQGIAQSFQSGQSGDLTALDIKGYHSSGTVNMTLEIRSGTNPVGGTVLATENFTFTGTSPLPITINFSNPPALTAGSDYIFVLLDGADPGLPILGTGTGNPYANGDVYQNIPPNWNPNTSIDAFFNTYISSASVVTITATDGAGNTATCESNVTVLDTLAPAVTCLNDTVILNSMGQATVAATDLVGSTADNCSVVDTTLSTSTFTAFQAGSNTVTVTVTDPSNNTATCTADVFVIEPAPTAVCQAVTVYLDGNGQATITADDVDNGSNSLVGIASKSINQSSFDCNNLGTNNVTLTVTSTLGGVDSCVAVVTVGDTTAPTLTCPANISINNDAGTCGAVVNFAAIASDNCTETVTYSHASGSVFSIGTTSVSVTASDASGNTTTCSFDVTVTDNEAPAIACPANMNVNTDAATCGATVTYAAPVGTDNCSGATTTQTAGLASGSLFPVGTTTNTFEVVDAAGNVTSCSFDVTVTDNEAPAIACPANINANTDAATCGATVTYAAPVGTDNCAGATTTQTAGLASGSLFPVGTTTNTFEVVDAAGNVTSCSFDVTVTDNEAPAIACPANINANTDAATCGATVTYAAPVGTDNCSGATTTQTAGLASGSLFPVGTTTNTFEVVDAAGNVTSCSFDVTVTDNEAPAIACPANINANTDAATCGATVTYAAPVGTDNCAGATTTQTAGLASGSLFPVGTTTNTFEVVDAAGNVTSCSFDVTVTDNEAPAIACPANINANTDAATCGATVTYAAPVGTDNCSGATTTQTAGLASGSLFPVGTTTNTFEVVDAAGNVTSCSFDVTVTDNEAPTALCQNLTVQLDINGVASITAAQIDNGSSDACGVASIGLDISNFDCADLGANAVVLTVTDVHGNTSTCSATVTVEESYYVNLTCANDISAACDFTQGGAVVNWNTPTAVTFSSCDSGCSSNTAIPGFIYMGELNGSRYYCSSTSNNTWQQSHAAAQAAGGHLAVINSAAENQFLANQLLANFAWIGLTDEAVEGQFEWVNNDPLTYNKWKNNEPNNVGGTSCSWPSNGADYAVIKKNNGKWFDRRGCSKYEFIMEVPCGNPTTITQIAGLSSGSLFTTGVHTITYSATDNVTGASDTCSFTVSVDTCNPVYCAAKGLNSSYEWIDEVQLVGEFTNNSGNDNGYGDYTNTTAHVNSGQNMTLNLTPGFSGCSYKERWRVWIDWNRDGDFYDAGEKVYSGSGTGMKTGSFTVPSNAAVGELRMRVAMRWGAWPWSCGTFWYGEVEDYTIVVDDATPGAAKFAGNDVNIEPTEDASASGFEFRTLYPNPAGSNSELNLEVRSGQEELVDLQLTNVMGQVLQSKQVNLQEGMNRVTFQTNNVSAGVYLLRVNGHQESIRLIIQ